VRILERTFYKIGKGDKMDFLSFNEIDGLVWKNGKAVQSGKRDGQIDEKEFRLALELWMHVISPTSENETIVDEKYLAQLPSNFLKDLEYTRTPRVVYGQGEEIRKPEYPSKDSDKVIFVSDGYNSSQRTYFDMDTANVASNIIKSVDKTNDHKLNRDEYTALLKR
jgi:hypothetical protein